MASVIFLVAFVAFTFFVSLQFSVSTTSRFNHTTSINTPFYAVRNGRVPGVYQHWEDCKDQVDRYPNNAYKRFNELREAVAFIQNGQRLHPDFVCLKENERTVTGSYRVYIGAASVSGKGRWAMRAGWAVYHGRSGYLNRFGFVATNDIASETLNRANLEGVRQALSIVPVGAPIELCLNSEFVVNCFTVWLEKWRINGFRNVRNEPIAHGPIIKSCLDLARRKNIDMTFKFIPAGINNFGSDAADFYAHAGAFKYGGDTLMPMLDPELGSI